MRQPMTRARAAVVIIFAVSLSIMIGACGSSSDGSNTSTAEDSTGGGSTTGAVNALWEGTGSLKGTGDIAVFYPSGGLLGNTLWSEGVEEVIKEYGYTPRLFSNEYSQPEQDQQVQQYLATSPNLAGSVVYPPVPEAANNTVRQLAKLAPVVQSTVGPDIEPAIFVATNQEEEGELMGKSYLRLEDKLKEEGKSLEPNILYFNVPESLHAGLERRTGFSKVLEAAGVTPNEVGESETVTGEQSGYEAANEILPKYKGKFTTAWVITLSGAAGVAKVLKENGYTPGKDVYIVSGGECTEYLSSVESGEIWSTVAQALGPEGRIVARTLVQAISAGGAVPGTTILPASAEEPPLVNEPPTQNVQVPQKAIVGKEEAQSLQLWGQGPDQICKR